MRTGGRFGLATVGLTFSATLELLLRSLADVVPGVDVLGTVLSLLFPLVSDDALLAWLVGWIFLTTLAYKTYERVDRLHGVSVQLRWVERAAAAVITATVGITVTQQLFVETFGHGSVPAPVAGSVFVLLLAAVGVRYVLRHDRFADDLYLAALLGPSMAIAAALYPLPEVAVVVWTVGAIGVNAVPFGPQLEQLLNDPIERLMLGVSAGRSGLQAFVTSLYIFAGILFSLAVVLDSTGTTGENLLTLLQSALAGRETGAFATTSLEADLFLLLVVFVPAVYGVWYWLRLVERLPFSFDLVDRPDSGDRDSDSSATDRVAHLTYRALPPGYGLPIGLLYVPLIVYVNVVQPSEPETFPLGYLVAAGALALVAVGTVLATRTRQPRPARGDVREVAPKAFALQVAVVVAAAEGAVPELVHGLLTLSLADGVGGSVLSAVGVTAIVAGGVYVPSTIPTLLETKPLLGGSLSAIVGGFLLGLLAGDVGLIRSLGGLIMIAGIVGVALWLFGEVSEVFWSD